MRRSNQLSYAAVKPGAAPGLGRIFCSGSGPKSSPLPRPAIIVPFPVGEFHASAAGRIRKASLRSPQRRPRCTPSGAARHPATKNCHTWRAPGQGSGDLWFRQDGQRNYRAGKDIALPTRMSPPERRMRLVPLVGRPTPPGVAEQAAPAAALPSSSRSTL